MVVRGRKRWYKRESNSNTHILNATHCTNSQRFRIQLAVFFFGECWQRRVLAGWIPKGILLMVLAGCSAFVVAPKQIMTS